MSKALATTHRDAGGGTRGRRAGANGAAPQTAIAPGEYQLIAVDRLKPTPDNPRVIHRDAAFAELVASIKSVGVLQPLVARPLAGTGDFDLRAGHRRLFAAKDAGLTEVPVIVREMDDATAMEVTVTENLQRENLSPLEEGRGVQRLLDVGWDVHRIADRLGKTPTWVARRAKIAHLSPAWQKLADNPKSPVIAWSSAMLECVAVLPAESQAALIEELPAYRLAGVDLAELRDLITRNILNRLHGAPFSPADANLVPKAGSCLECLKRSGKQPTLFDVKAAKDGEIDKMEVCLDQTCYRAKCAAQVRIQVERARLRHGEKLTALINPNDHAQATCAKEIGIRPVVRWDVEKAKKADPKAVPAIDLETGAVEFVRVRRAAASGNGTSAAPKRSADEDRDARRKKHVLAALRYVLTTAAESDSGKELPGVDELDLEDTARLAITFGTDFSYREVQPDPGKWTPVKVCRGKNAARMLLQCVLPQLEQRIYASTMDGVLARYPDAKPICELLGIDQGRLEAAALAEFPEPAKKKDVVAVAGKCRKCGCTDGDCRQCIKKTGRACTWVKPNLCSACVGQVKAKNGKRRA